MKKILEVLQYGDTDIRFNTDIDVRKNPNAVMDILSRVAYAMTTSLWGGNEMSVLAMIRTLSIADLAVSVNREEMIHQLDETSAMLARSYAETLEMMRRKGKVVTFPPGVAPSGRKS